MKPLPHEYTVTASALDKTAVTLTSQELPPLESAPPREFDGPGDKWSPEEFLLAAVADCFVLTFRAIARASRLSWNRVDATAVGVLARIDRVTRFSEVRIDATLTLPAGDAGSDEAALHLLEKAERTCLVSNSLAVPTKLAARIVRETSTLEASA